MPVLLPDPSKDSWHEVLYTHVYSESKGPHSRGRIAQCDLPLHPPGTTTVVTVFGMYCTVKLLRPPMIS